MSTSGFILALAAFLGLFGGLLWLLRRAPWRGPRPRYPIVLIKGLFGFDEIKLGDCHATYFRGVSEHLGALGIEVHQLSGPAVASIRERGQVLAQKLEALPCRKVNLIAHSMGGLDARYAIACLGQHRKVRSLVTIGTPHHGTELADLVSGLLALPIGLRTVFDKLGLPPGAFDDLSCPSLEVFNKNTPDHWRVFYGCVLGRTPPQGGGNKLLVPTNQYLKQKAGDNDGVVSLRSQRWGQVLEEVDLDHWAQIGWGQSAESMGINRLYERIALGLRQRGC